MSKRAHGQLRRSQIITTYGPGALIDLPKHAGIVAGLETWGRVGDLPEVVEPRLARKLQAMTGVSSPRLFAPPADENDPSQPKRGIGAWRFPEWFVVREKDPEGGQRQSSRRLVHRKSLDDKGRVDGEGLEVIPTRFVRACRNGHVDDLDWHAFVHQGAKDCPRTRQLWLDELGTSGDLNDLAVRCECQKWRGLFEATLEGNTLGGCSGARPWLGRDSRETCTQPSRLLIRTAANAYFPQVVSVLSLPDRGSAVQSVVRELWDDMIIVDGASELAFVKKKPKVAQALAPFDDQEVLATVYAMKSGSTDERAIKDVELDALLSVPEGYGDDVPVDPNFHARRLPEHVWRRSERSTGVASVIQVHRLREVMALVGFTRFEAVTPDIDGEYESGTERAVLADAPQWFPAVENRGEGVFVQLDAGAVAQWLARGEVAARLDLLRTGYQQWAAKRRTKRAFPGGPYVLLHTLSHLLLQSLSMRCGYPASSIRERIYADSEARRFGVLLYTGSPDADGTLGGLVQQARYLETHLGEALRAAALCSNDPICAQHAPGESLEERWLHGAACHGCALVAETSCETRNDFLDRALVVPILSERDAAFFDAVP